MPLTSKQYDAKYYEEHKADGLDYAVYGDWQRDYGRWLVDALQWQGRTILDVGCACGSIARGILDAGARHVCGVDLCEPMVVRGREQLAAPGLRLDVCDAVNLHLFNDGDFDGIHSAQVAEHWRPEHVPLILTELRRVAKLGSVLYLALDTAELFARQGRPGPNEDPTHICIRDAAWWVNELSAAGWRPSPAIADDLSRHPIFRRRFVDNDWDFFVCQAVDRPTSSSACRPAIASCSSP